MSVLLCSCNGKIGSVLDLESIKTHLEEKGQKVIIANKPCEDGIKCLSDETDSLVIGGCRNETHKTRFREIMRKKGIDPFAISYISLIGEHSIERAQLLLMAAVERLKLFRGAKEDNLQPRFGQIDGKVSRRQFLTMPKIQHALIPSIEADKCKSLSYQCRLCSRKCLKEAIIFDNERPASIQKDKCSGCGMCVGVCPSDAIVYPYFTAAEIMRELDVLIRGDGGINRHAHAILFACEKSSSLLDDYLSSGGNLPEGILPVILPCICMLNTFFFMYSFVLGAAGIGLISCHRDCRRKGRIEDTEGDILLTEAILESLGVEGKRLTLINISSPSEVEDKIRIFKDGLSSLGTAISKGSEIIKGFQGQGYLLKKLLVKISDITCRNILVSGYPSIPAGFVWLDNEDSCTFCGVCETRCPADAIVLEGDEGFKKLMFDYKNCIGCAECVHWCPEKALRIKKIIDAEKLATAQKTLLAREHSFLCRECGKPYLNKSMLKKITTILSTPEAEFVIKLCPECRMKKAFSPLNHT